MRSYLDYYHGSRSHLGLEKDSPDTRAVSRATGNVIAFPKVGGLHHRYERLAAWTHDPIKRMTHARCRPLRIQVCKQPL